MLKKTEILNLDKIRGHVQIFQEKERNLNLEWGSCEIKGHFLCYVSPYFLSLEK